MAYKCECIICRNYDFDEDLDQEYDLGSLFHRNGREMSVKLCKTHAIELFKKGQKKFLLSHYKILVDIIKSDDAQFIELLEETVRKNLNSIY